MDLNRIRELAGLPNTDQSAKKMKLTESAPPGMEKTVMQLKKEYPGDEAKAFATAWAIYNKKHTNEEESFDEEFLKVNTPLVDDIIFGRDNSNDIFSLDSAVEKFNTMVDTACVDPEVAYNLVVQELDDSDIEEFESRIGKNSIADHSDEEEIEYIFDENYDFNNGYDSIVVPDKDYFPTGADTSVISKTGNSPKQGDNPEQKKLAIAEMHRNYVYKYRKYLQESIANSNKVDILELHESPKVIDGMVQYNGDMVMEGTLSNSEGRPVNVQYLVTISASSMIDRVPQTSRTPGTRVEYSSEVYDVTVSHVKLSDVEIDIDQDNYSKEEAVNKLGIDTFKYLTTPNTYIEPLSKVFQKYIDNID